MDNYIKRSEISNEQRAMKIMMISLYILLRYVTFMSC